MSSAAWSCSGVASLTALLAVIYSEAAWRGGLPWALTVVCEGLRACRDPEPGFGSWCRHDKWHNDG